MIAFTIHRYIFNELFKVFMLTTVALTLIFSLVSTLAPMQEYGVGPEQVVSILTYFLPITLTFVLPISAMFSASLVYGRLAGDNELDACRAGGISLMTVIYPAICLAIIVGILNLVLSFYIVPDFVHRAERTIKDNAKQILFRNIQRKGYYVLPNKEYVIRADHAIPDQDTLLGVIIVESKRGELSRLITAESAKIQIQKVPGENINEVTVVAGETYQVTEQGDQVYSSRLPVRGTFEPLLADKIKFQKIEQIKRIQQNIMNFNPIRKLAFNAGSQLAMELLAQDINESITTGRGEYYTITGDRKVLRIKSGRAYVPGNTDSTGVDDVILLPAESAVEGREIPLEVIEYDKESTEPIYKYYCKSAKIKLDQHVNQVSPLVVILENAISETPEGRRSLAPAARKTFMDISFPPRIRMLVDDGVLLDTIDSAESVLQLSPSAKFKKFKAVLYHKIGDAHEDILSETHSRLVFGMGCIPLILISIAYGIKLKGGHLLSAFGVSSIPAAVLIVAIMTGKNLITGASGTNQALGVMVMWICMILLCIFTWLTYRFMMKT